MFCKLFFLQLLRKIWQDGRRLNKFEEYLYENNSGSFNGCPCRPHCNFFQKAKFSCKARDFLLKTLICKLHEKFLCNPRLPGAKHRENKCFVCTARWLFSHRVAIVRKTHTSIVYVMMLMREYVNLMIREGFRTFTKCHLKQTRLVSWKWHLNLKLKHYF